MNVYTLELTETELACGVTLDAVADDYGVTATDWRGATKITA